MANYKRFRYKTYRLSPSCVVVRVWRRYGKIPRWSFEVNGYLPEDEIKEKIRSALDSLVGLA